jgi:O-antigen/teichoic acid export membrane protein
MAILRARTGLANRSLTDRVLGILPAPLAKRILNIPTGRRLISSAVWNLFSAVAGRVLTFPVGVVLARLMGRTGYGELGIIYASVELFGVFGGFGLGMTATKYVSELRVKDPARAGRIMGLSMLVTAMTGTVLVPLIVFLAPWLAAGPLAAPGLVTPLRISSLLLFLTVVDGAQGGALSGFEAFKVLARLRVIKGALDLPLLMSGYFAGGLTGVLWGAVASRAVGYTLNRIALRAEARRAGVPFSFHGSLQELTVLRDFSIPALVSGILVGPVNWLCSAMLVNQQHGYAEMGAYSVANQWYNFIVFVPFAIGGGILPILSDRLGNQDVQITRDVLRFMMRLNVAISGPLVIIMSALSPLIMTMYGPDYHGAWPTLIVVVLTGAVLTVMTPVGEVIAAAGHMWLGCLMNLGWAAAYVGATALLVPKGSLGLASARLIAYIVHATWTFWFAFSVLKRKEPPSLVLEKATPD